MRIALLPDDYLPSSTLVHAKMFHELAHEFMKQGHDVVVITPGVPNQIEKLIIETVEGVVVWRFRAGLRRGVGKLRRAINESFLSLSAWRAIKYEVNKAPFDLCINYSPTIFFGNLTAKLRSLHSTYVYLVLRDMFPQWAIDEGLIIQGSLIEKYFRFFERLNYSSADFIGLMSLKNLQLFEKMTGSIYRTEVLYNWADKDAFPCKSHVFGVRELLGLQDKVIYFYGGNIGHAQDMGNLLRLAEAMRHIDSAHFIFLGQGDEVDLVKSTIESKKLINCSFMPSVSQQEYKLLLNEIDVGLFSLSANHTAHNFPGKLLGYMVHSLPILGSVNKGNDLIDVIHTANAGFIYNNGDDHAFYEAAKKLAIDVSLRKKIGQNANQLLAEKFSVESAALKILNSFTKNKEKKMILPVENLTL